MSIKYSLIVLVNRKQKEADKIVSFELIDPHGRPLPDFDAGAHVHVQLYDSLSRQYSICNDPSDQSRYRLAVLHEEQSRGGSDFMHQKVSEGDLLTISAPQNHFQLNHDAGHSILFAGGIGITPILSMAKVLSDRGQSLELHYAAKSKSKMAFWEEIRHSNFFSVTQFYFSDQTEKPSFRQQLAQLIPPPDKTTHIYMCGPYGFIEAVMNAFAKQGWDKLQLHSELFSGQTMSNQNQTDSSFQVELAQSGLTFTIPAHRTVFEVLDENGIFISTSCEEGVCGTCLIPVLEGVPDHRDSFLSDEEHAANDQFTPCCSRSKSAKLVLDL